MGAKGGGSSHCLSFPKGPSLVALESTCAQASRKTHSAWAWGSEKRVRAPGGKGAQQGTTLCSASPAAVLSAGAMPAPYATEALLPLQAKAAAITATFPKGQQQPYCPSASATSGKCAEHGVCVDITKPFPTLKPVP